MMGIMKTPAVILVNPKYSHNLAAAIRACSCFGVETLLYTGDRMNVDYRERLPREERMKGYKEVIWKRNDYPLVDVQGTPICVEVREESEPLTTFQHPEDGVYMFGPEDGSVPGVFRRWCHRFVHIPAYHCLNLAGAMNVVLAHRMMQRQLNGKHPLLRVGEMLKETRGELQVAGWEGK